MPTERQVFDLLLLLAENPGRVVTRNEIVEAVWPGRIVSESAISARKLAAGIPDAEFVVPETANHMPIPGNPACATYINSTLDFLAG